MSRRRPLLLDLFCGQGGAGRGYADAGFEVIGVDIANHEERYESAHKRMTFVQGDALEYVAKHGHKFDVIHASPPCQFYSERTRPEYRANHPDLIAPTREALRAAERPWVIENVQGAKRELIEPVRLCGSAFGLGVQRHRWFESSHDLTLVGVPCVHANQPARYDIYDHGKWYKSRVVAVYGNGGGKGKEHWADAMGIDWMDHAGMAESIPPAYTRYLGKQIREELGI